MQAGRAHIPLSGNTTVGCLGPAGTFSELASNDETTRNVLGVELSTETTFCTTIGELVSEVMAERLSLAVLPLENSIEGSVDETLDALAGASDAATIVAETILPIEHLLIAPAAVDFTAVTKVFSHPQPLNQCRRFLQENLTRAQTVPCTSTAEAVALIAKKQAGAERWAAIGTRRAAELHNCQIIARDIADATQNVTRFAWVANRNQLPWPLATDASKCSFRTSLAFNGPGDQTPGWLLRCLTVFAEGNINLTRIESRPLRQQLGHYRFFVDLEGQSQAANITSAITELDQYCDEIKVLGSYPVKRAAFE